MDYKSTLLKRPSIILRKKVGLQRYLSYFFIKQNSKAYPKFQLAHDIILDKIFEGGLFSHIEQHEEC